MGTLLSGIFSVSVFLMSRIPHVVRPICLEDRFDNPGGLLHVSSTMIVGSLGSYGQLQILGLSDLIGMNILFRCPLPSLLC